MDVDAKLFEIADRIAEKHLPRSWLFPTASLVKKIKLRTDIYRALEEAILEGKYDEQA